MAYIVADPCVKCKYTDCVAVCPVDCFYEGINSLVIHPDECIDCGACEPECPTTAIFEEGDLPDKWAPYIEINSVLSGVMEPGDANTDGWPKKLAESLSSGFAVWPNIVDQKEPLPGADDFAQTENKLEDLDPRLIALRAEVDLAFELLGDLMVESRRQDTVHTPSSGPLRVEKLLEANLVERLTVRQLDVPRGAFDGKPEHLRLVQLIPGTQFLWIDELAAHAQTARLGVEDRLPRAGLRFEHRVHLETVSSLQLHRTDLGEPAAEGLDPHPGSLRRRSQPAPNLRLHPKEDPHRQGENHDAKEDFPSTSHSEPF